MARQLSSMLSSDGKTFSLSSSSPQETVQPTRESVVEFFGTLSPRIRHDTQIPSKLISAALEFARIGTRVRTFGWLASRMHKVSGDECFSETPDVEFSSAPGEQEIATFMFSLIIKADGEEVPLMSNAEWDCEEVVEIFESIKTMLDDSVSIFDLKDFLDQLMVENAEQT